MNVMSISDASLAYSIVELEQTIKESSVSITFWGSRIVSSKDHSFSASLDPLARAAMRIDRERYQARDLSWKERASGVTIIKNLQRFYTDSDSAFKRSNIITKLFYILRNEFQLTPYTTRFWIEDGMSFRRISGDNFRELFGAQPWQDRLMLHPHLNGAACGGFLLKEGVIREFAQKEQKGNI